MLTRPTIPGLNYQVWLINLDSAKQRLANCTRLLDEQHICFERLPAVNGETLSEQDIGRVYQQKFFHGYHKTLNSGEVGCYLSHRMAWQKILDCHLDFAVILEDDINLLGDLNATLTAIARLPQNWDYIKLANWKKRRTLYSQTVAGLNVVTYNKIPAQTCAQIVSASGAKKLLANSLPFHRPVDIDIQHWWEKDLQIFGISPSLVETIPEDSQIDAISLRKSSSTHYLARFYNQLCFYVRNKLHTSRRIKQLKQADLHEVNNP